MCCRLFNFFVVICNKRSIGAKVYTCSGMRAANICYEWSWAYACSGSNKDWERSHLPRVILSVAPEFTIDGDLRLRLRYPTNIVFRNVSARIDNYKYCIALHRIACRRCWCSRPGNHWRWFIACLQMLTNNLIDTVTRISFLYTYRHTYTYL